MTMRRAFLRLVPVLGLLLLAGWLGVALHHHSEAEAGPTGPSCLICLAGQAQATNTPDTPAPPHETRASGIVLVPESEAGHDIAPILGARAPPAS